MSKNQTKGKSEAELWGDLIQAELKTGSKLGKCFEKAVFMGCQNKTLTLYFSDEQSCKEAKGLWVKLQQKLPYQIKCDRFDFKIGTVPKSSTKTVTSSTSQKTIHKSNNPLMALALVEPNIHLEQNYQPVLKATVEAEKNCISIYQKLEQRTKILVGADGLTFNVNFNWRVRVGGNRGFLDLLLPVFHPVFGIPYIPASTLKGVARSWAKKQGNEEIANLLGTLDGSKAIAAKVQFLDAFPLKPCLGIDVATPQYHWRGEEVKYSPEPHPLLTMEQPQLLIGLCPTSLGNQSQVETVKNWLENALKNGIGSRVSSGYGRALGSTSSNFKKTFDFEFWTQGIYGHNPPARDNNYQGTTEFRPTSVRGILRFWFRAIALSLYPVNTAMELEELMFGKLSQLGKISLNTIVNLPNKKNPYLYEGKIILEAPEQKYLDLASNLLILASHLGGFGRGSRRPLHILNSRERGCHWELITNVYPLDYDQEQWKQLITQIHKDFKKLNNATSQQISDPGGIKQRKQDVLDQNAQIWLLKSPEQTHPSKVKNWQNEGNQNKFKGTALTLFYSDKNFKGKGKDGGNENVGGSLGTPSYVWIKSIFPMNKTPYQVITIFGANNSQRQAFAQELKKQGAIKVFGRDFDTNQAKTSTSKPKQKK